MKIDLTGRGLVLACVLGLSPFSSAAVLAQASRPLHGIQPGVALEASPAKTSGSLNGHLGPLRGGNGVPTTDGAGELAITGISSLLVADDMTTISLRGVCVRNYRATAASDVQIEFWVSDQVPTVGGDLRHTMIATYPMGLVQGSSIRCVDPGAIPMAPPDPGTYWFSVALFEGSGASRNLQYLLTVTDRVDFGGPFYIGNPFFETPASYSVTNSGNSISVQLKSIRNASGIATRQLALGVWATTNVLRYGGPLPGEAIAWKTYEGLGGYSQYTNIDTGTLTVTQPAPGTYWISAVLLQLGTDGKTWDYSCVYNFSSPFTFAGASPSPSADFTFSPSSPTAGQVVAFTDTSTGTPTTWSWSFGDGASSSSRNPTHAYSAAGEFSVTLTASNSSGSSTNSKTVNVTAPASSTYVGAWILPSSARAPGVGAFWTTDLTVMNTGDVAANIAIKFLGHGADGMGGPERSYPLGPRSTLSWPDVLGGMFSLDTDWGPILIRASVTSIVAQGQTWTASLSGGSYGQSVPALGPSEAAGSTPKAIAGIRQDSAFRTNIILANLKETDASVSLTILRQDGSTASTKTVALGPLGFSQLNVLNDFGISNLPSGSVLVSSTGQVAAYASVIDNVTADPRTIMAR